MDLRAPLVALALATVGFAGLASGNHVQQESGRSLSFDHKTGNEWWVEVVLGGSSASQVTRVEARDDGGAWTALTYRDWGAWAASFHVEPGHRVEFRAFFPDGASMQSCPFTHPQGAEQCGSSGGGGGGAFAFDHKTGNEWWVEVLVSPRPVAVQAMDTGGAWVSLTFRDWGAWAASFRIEPGHDVRFRAQDAAGAWHESCWFTHPGGTEKCDGGTTPPPPEEFDATFRPKAGNQWWVETYVDANEPLAGVDARVVGGPWHALAKRSWGAWAASFHVPDGSHVEFRARSADGDSDLSGRYRWPGAMQVADEDDPWPREGSYVRYLLDSGESVPGYSVHTDLWLNYTYSGGAWRGTCEGWRVERVSDHPENRTRLRHDVTAPPPTGGPEHVQPGERVEIGVPRCGDEGDGSTSGFVDGRGLAGPYHGTPRKEHGQPVDVPVWRASYEDDGCPCQWRALSWHWDTGLTIDVDVQYRYSGSAAHLVDTDAPISEEETSDPPAPGAWPKEGSFVEYQVNLTSEYSDAVERVDVRFVYVGGAWQATCGDRTATAAPPMGPTDASPGAWARPTEVSQCRITPPAVVVQGRFPEDTTVNGQPHRATAWWADEHPEQYGDEDAWWDVDTGLLLRWEDHGGYFRGDEGRLTNTDAPLSSG